MRINKEGYRILTASFCIVLAISAVCVAFLPLWLAYILSLLLLITFGFILWFFREPERPYLSEEGTVFSPADGKIVVIEEIEEKEYLGERRVQVSVFMSLTNVHINWFPVEGKVEYFKYHPGKFMVAWNPKSSEENERTTTVINTGKEKVLFRQIAGFLARRIVSYAIPDKNVKQNEKCGFIKFGSRVDIILPTDCEILVDLGDMVVGSQTPIAKLKRD